MMIPDDKAVFLKMLASDYNIQQDVVLQLANQLATAQVNISLRLCFFLFSVSSLFLRLAHVF